MLRNFCTLRPFSPVAHSPSGGQKNRTIRVHLELDNSRAYDNRGRLLAHPAKRIYTSPGLTVAPFV
jgi:hypothetical protein